jgi:Family of unknown function (DUF6325)
MPDVETHGPIDFLLLEFPGESPTGAAGDALRDLVERGLVRIYDLLLIRKSEDGAISGVELTDVSQEGMGGFTAFAGARSGLLTDDDLREASDAMKPGTAAALVVYENTWAIPFVRAALDAGAELIASERIPGPVVMEALDALEALETAS